MIWGEGQGSETPALPPPPPPHPLKLGEEVGARGPDLFTNFKLMGLGVGAWVRG